MLQSRRAIEEETYANMSELPAEADQLELTLASISPLLGTSLSDISETCRDQSTAYLTALFLGEHWAKKSKSYIAYHLLESADFSLGRCSVQLQW